MSTQPTNPIPTVPKGGEACGDCYAQPGERHELSCSAVTTAAMEAFLAGLKKGPSK